jgi:hypothetical protein
MGEQIKSVGRRLWHERDQGMGQTVVRNGFNAKKREEGGDRGMAIRMKGEKSMKTTK